MSSTLTTGNWFIDFRDGHVPYLCNPKPIKIVKMTEKTVLIQIAYDDVLAEKEDRGSRYMGVDGIVPKRYKIHNDNGWLHFKIAYPFMGAEICYGLQKHDDMAVYDSYEEIKKMDTWSISDVRLRNQQIRKAERRKQRKAEKTKLLILGLVRSALPVELKKMITEWF